MGLKVIGSEEFKECMLLANEMTELIQTKYKPSDKAVTAVLLSMLAAMKSQDVPLEEIVTAIRIYYPAVRVQLLDLPS